MKWCMLLMNMLNNHEKRTEQNRTEHDFYFTLYERNMHILIWCQNFVQQFGYLEYENTLTTNEQKHTYT